MSAPIGALPFTVAHCVAANSRAFPDRVAVEEIDPAAPGVAARSYTFQQAWNRALALAESLGPVTPGPNGPMVGVLLPQSADAAFAYLAAQVAGAAAVPLNTRLAADELRYVLTDAGATALLCGGDLLPGGAALAEELGVRLVDAAGVAAGPRGAVDMVGTGSSRAVVGYTSGTTGFPKGTSWSNEGWLTRLFQWGWTFGLTPDKVLSVPGPIFHLSFGGLTLGSLAIGAKARILTSFEAEAAAEEYAHHATFVFLVPSMLAMIAEWWREAGRPELGALQVLLSSGAPGPMALLDEAFDVFPNARITEAYGWTEGGWVTYEAKDRAALVPHSVGWPMVGAEVAVVDEEGKELGVGEAGEVVARSLVGFDGYLNQPEATMAAGTASGFVRSGDVGIWLADGRLSIVDRVKDMIISGGENVYCAEVERVLVEHPAVLEAAVVGLADEAWGERVTAAVVARPGQAIAGEDVVAFCRERLAHYKCPKAVIVVEALPRNPMGKVQKFRLVEELAV